MIQHHGETLSEALVAIPPPEFQRNALSKSHTHYLLSLLIPMPTYTGLRHIIV